MALHTSPTVVLNKVATSLVATKRYPTTEDALWDMALSTVRGKVTYYRRRIRRLENKHGVHFDSFTKQLKGSGSASPVQEDRPFHADGLAENVSGIAS
jgi:hypothetical protein